MRPMRIESLIIGMDFSDPAIEGARWVVEHFAVNAAVTLVHVVGPPSRPGFIARVLPAAEPIDSLASEAADARLRDVIANVAPSATCEVRVGKPHEQIAAAARERRADLVVVGPHGDGAARRPWLGSTAERVVHCSPAPVLVTSDPPPGGVRRILVPIDENRLTDSILGWAAHLAQAFDAEVKLLHVWSEAIFEHVASMARVTTADRDEARREIVKDVDEAAAHWLADLAAAGFRGGRATAVVSHGKAGDVTLETAAAYRADLIVIGRNAGGPIAPALLGSTLRTVLHHARCPVFVVTEPQEQK